jgi:hypothetical protein
VCYHFIVYYRAAPARRSLFESSANQQELAKVPNQNVNGKTSRFLPQVVTTWDWIETNENGAAEVELESFA